MHCTNLSNYSGAGSRSVITGAKTPFFISQPQLLGSYWHWTKLFHIITWRWTCRLWRKATVSVGGSRSGWNFLDDVAACSICLIYLRYSRYHWAFRHTFWQKLQPYWSNLAIRSSIVGYRFAAIQNQFRFLNDLDNSTLPVPVNCRCWVASIPSMDEKQVLKNSMVCFFCQFLDADLLLQHST